MNAELVTSLTQLALHNGQVQVNGVSDCVKIENNEKNITFLIEVPASERCEIVVAQSADLAGEYRVEVKAAVGKGAALSLVWIQKDQAEAVRFEKNDIALQEGATFSGVWINKQAHVLERAVEVAFHGESIHAQLEGLSLLTGNSSVKTSTHLQHHFPNTTAAQHFKSILSDESVAEFNGLVFVDSKAQKTDSNQYNHNLLLSDRARAISRPQLEIFADDVKCSHGATVGQLDKDHLFYLETRGIGQAQAKSMLLYGFAEEIIEKIENDAARHDLEASLKSDLLVFE